MKGTTFDEVSNGRSNNFDFLRFLFASLVIFAHSFPCINGDTYNGYDPLNHWSKGQTAFGGLSVECFFLISGFLITKSWIYSKNIKEFSKKRLLRIVPALAVVLLFIVFVVGPLGTADRAAYFHNPKTYKYLGIMFAKDMSGSDYLPGVFTKNPWPGGVNGSLWTIRYEVVCYAMVALFGFLQLYRRRSLVLLIFLGLFVLRAGDIWNHIYLPALGIDHVFDLGKARSLVRLTVFFQIGMLLYLYREKIPYSKIAFWISVLGLWITDQAHSLQYVLPLFGAYVLFYIAFNPNIKLQQFARNGDLSYGIYLYAFPIQQLLVLYFRNHLNPFSLFLLSLVICCALAKLSWHYVEHPFLKLKSKKIISVTNTEIAATQNA